jgi:hypothetical protein
MARKKSAASGKKSGSLNRGDRLAMNRDTMTHGQSNNTSISLGGGPKFPSLDNPCRPIPKRGKNVRGPAQ